MAMARSNTDRFLPLVPSAVEPKQEVQRLPAAVQQQYVKARETVDP